MNTKNGFEFFANEYTMSQLVKKYDFNTLMSYYIFGLNTLKKIEYIIDFDLYEETETTPEQIYNDKHYFFLRTFIIKLAMEKIGACEVNITNDSLFVNHLN